MMLAILGQMGLVCPVLGNRVVAEMRVPNMLLLHLCYVMRKYLKKKRHLGH